jgi:hypothetical protein
MHYLINGPKSDGKAKAVKVLTTLPETKAASW